MSSEVVFRLLHSRKTRRASFSCVVETVQGQSMRPGAGPGYETARIRKDICKPQSRYIQSGMSFLLSCCSLQGLLESPRSSDERREKSRRKAVQHLWTAVCVESVPSSSVHVRCSSTPRQVQGQVLQCVALQLALSRNAKSCGGADVTRVRYPPRFYHCRRLGSET
jgi:hypothetical protein